MMWFTLLPLLVPGGVFVAQKPAPPKKAVAPPAVPAAPEKLRLVPPVGHKGWVQCIAVAPKGDFVASGSDDRTIRLWEVATGREVRTFSGHTSGVGDLEFTRDGKFLVSASGDGTIRIWDVATGKQLKQIAAPTVTLPSGSSPRYYFNTLSLTPDGNGALVTMYREDFGTNQFVDFIDFKTGKPAPQNFPQGVASAVWHASLSPDGNTYLFMQMYDAPPMLWNRTTRKSLLISTAKGAQVVGDGFTPDGKQVVLALGNEIIFYDAATGARQRSLKNIETKNFRFLLSPDSKVLTATEDGYNRRFFTYDAATGASLHPPTQVIPDSARTFAFLPGNNREMVMIDPRHSPAFVGIQTGIVTRRAPATALAPLALFSGARRALVPGLDNTLCVWDAIAGAAVRDLGTTVKPVTGAEISPDGRYVLGYNAAARGAFFLWNAADGKLRREAPDAVVATGYLASRPYFRADGTRFALSETSKVVVIDTETFRPVCETDMGRERMSTIGFGGDGDKYLLVGTWEGPVRVKDGNSGETIRPLFGHTGVVTVVSSMAGGATIVSASQDGTVRFWNPEDGRSQRVLKATEGGVIAIAISPDEKRLVASTTSGALQVFDLSSTNNAPVATLTGLASPASYLSLSEDGTQVAAVSKDEGILRWWKLDNTPANSAPVLSSAWINTDDTARRVDWLSYTAQGYFDGSPDAMSHTHFARGLQTFGVGQFAEKFYVPGIARTTLLGSGQSGDAGSLDTVAAATPPRVRITVPPSGSGATVNVTVEATEQGGGGIKAIRLYQNGRLVGGPAQAVRGIVIEPAGGSANSKSFSVTLAPGSNAFRAVAYSKTNVESTPAEAALEYNPPAPPKPTLHVLTVGINTYADSGMNLSYARPDADAIAGIFDQPAAQSLYAAAKVTRLLDNAATGDAVKSAFGKLATDSKPDDVVFIYLAGHGETAGGMWHFLPADAKQMALEERVKQYGIPWQTVENAVAQIPARKIVLVVDACKSGAALEKGNRGVGDEQIALAEMARAQGIHILTASTAQQYAGEVKELGHGILTYALLEALSGKSSTGILTVSDLISYVEGRVPALAKQYRGGEQFPVPFDQGQNFPLINR